MAEDQHETTSARKRLPLPPEHPLVRRVHLMRAEGSSVDTIAARLNAEGAQNPWDKRWSGRLVALAIPYPRSSTPQPVLRPWEADVVTGLPTRAALTALVDDVGLDSRLALVLGVCDLVDVNSALGRTSGDAVLVQLAARLAALVRQGWFVGRGDGSSFVAFAPFDASEQQAEDLCADLLAVLAEPFVLDAGGPLHLSGTIGAAVSDDQTATTGDQLLVLADVARLRVRRSSRPWAVHDPALDGDRQNRLARVEELREAIRAGQLEVHYQPVVRLADQAVSSVEALLRWRHPERGLVSPGVFIDLAEQCGLMGELTKLLISDVGPQVQAWAAAGSPLRCAVNLSVSCLLSAEEDDGLIRALAELGGAVTVEVTESVFADARAVAVLKRLADAGVPCAIDDFGTGYSCLSALQSLPVTTVKIDRAFVSRIEQDPRKAAVVHAIVGMSRALGLDTIAEGIETEAAAACLVELGVDRGQGFHYARPMPPAELDSWLAGRTVRAEAACAGPDDDEHQVLFYDDDEDQVRELVRHVVTTLSSGGRALVIATPEHRHALMRALPATTSWGASQVDGRLRAFDAQTLLDGFMRAGLPDGKLFREAMEALVDQSATAWNGPLSVYSEVVALLWKQGNVVSALQLEELWNDLRSSRSFSLLCAHSLAEARSGSVEGLADICHHHTLVHMGRPTGRAAETLLETLAVLLESTRTLLHVDSSEQTVGVLMRAVSDLGGTTVPADHAPAHALPIDVSLGGADPLLAVAPVGSSARRHLELLLPGLVEDARAAARRADRLVVLAGEVSTDPLTGLGNRRGITRLPPLTKGDAIAMVDLDRFKEVNDAQGHQVGDRVLVAFSRTLRQHTRARDLVFRFGGEEFLVVFPGTTPERALVALENLRLHWQAERPMAITFSAGVALSAGGDLASALELADAALYEAKAAGRDRFVLAAPPLLSRAAGL